MLLVLFQIFPELLLVLLFVLTAFYLAVIEP